MYVFTFYYIRDFLAVLFTPMPCVLSYGEFNDTVVRGAICTYVLCTRVCIYECVYMDVYMCVCTNLCMCVYVYMRVCIYVCMYVIFNNKHVPLQNSNTKC